MLFTNTTLIFACRSLSDNNYNFNDGVQFVRNLYGYQYTSLGRKINISDFGDRKLDYSLLDFDYQTKTFEVRRQASVN